MLEAVRDLQSQMEGQGYITDQAIATTVYLAMALHKPVLIEGQAGVGKTEVAKVLSAMLETRWPIPRGPFSATPSCSSGLSSRRSPTPTRRLYS